MESLLVFLKCISDQNRLIILRLLAEGEFCVCQLQKLLNRSQSSVSQHLSYFKELDLLKERQSGKWIYYTLNRQKYDNYLAQLLKFTSIDFKKAGLTKLDACLKDLPSAAEIKGESLSGQCCE